MEDTEMHLAETQSQDDTPKLLTKSAKKRNKKKQKLIEKE
jgi:hypothetical protein